MREREAKWLIRLRGSPLALLAAAFAFAGDLCTGSPGFGQPDSNGLLPAGDFLAGSAAAKRAALALAHHFLNLLGRLLAVLPAAALLRHRGLLSGIWPRCLNKRLQPA